MRASVVLFSLSTLFSCATAQKVVTQSPPNSTFLLESQFKDFIPISPLEFDQEVEIYNKTTGQFEQKRIKELAADRLNIIKLLPNEAVYTAVEKIDASGQIKYGPASITAEAGTYKITMDYCKFTTLKVNADSGICAGFAKVGIGLRIRASVTTFDANVDISSLFALGVSASAKKLKGQLSVDVIGMESAAITDLIVMPVDISEASIQTALQSMAAIKTKIYESSANLYPQVVSIKKTVGGCSALDILKNIDPTNRNRIPNR